MIFSRQLFPAISAPKPESNCVESVAQAFQPAGSRDFPVPCFNAGTGDWKVARTRRQECLRYSALRHLRQWQRLVSGLSFLFFLAIGSPASGRTTQDFDAGWRFSKGDLAAAMMPAFDDGGWQSVTLPHDWSSDGPFSADFGSGNGYAPGGIGWYRKHFRLDAPPASKSVTLEFDGVYDDSEVWVNGQYAGGRPYGFSSFQCDLTPFVKFGARDNVVAVRVDHSRFADSRYYTGSGIYRNARLVVADSLHVAHWGVAITTPAVKADSATVHVETTLENCSGTNESVALETELVAPDGSIAGMSRTTAEIPGMGAPTSGTARFDGVVGVQASAWPGNTLKRELQRAGTVPGAPTQEVTQEMVVRNPLRWNLDDPKLYRAVSKIIAGGMVLDEVTNTFGIREFQFDANRGFFLNGKNLKIKGVCLHHDAGPIGAAVPDKVLERRLRTLKEIGVNAIRTSHNPPDPALLDLCDRLGFLVMDEAFDEFTPGKNKWVTGRNDGVPSHFGYGEIFAQWAVTDIQDLVRRAADLDLGVGVKFLLEDFVAVLFVARIEDLAAVAQAIERRHREIEVPLVDELRHLPIEEGDQ